jgi:sugar lactone lactonase YvrE
MTYRIIRTSIAATTIAGGLAGAAILAASDVSATPPNPAAQTATPAAPATPPPVGTLSTLPYTFPAGSGGSLVNPLGISAFNGNVYVSNSADNVLSLLVGGTTTTVAGSLEGIGESGDGGPATAATLTEPAGTTEDAAGNVYIADTEDNVIRKIDVTTGIIRRVAGTGMPGNHSHGRAALRSELDAPQGVAVDAAGDLFIADTVNNQVVEVRPNGHFEVLAGTGKAGYRGDGGRAGHAQLTEPTGVAVDSAGNVYIADAGNNVVRRVDASTGIITTVAGNVAADQANGGLGGFSGDGGRATLAQLNDPEGVALDSAGDLFIADTFNNAIREVTPDGTIFTVVNKAGTNGAAPARGGETPGPANASDLAGPTAVAVDNSTSTVYIADTSNNKAAAVTGLAQSGAAPGPTAS